MDASTLNTANYDNQYNCIGSLSPRSTNISIKTQSGYNHVLIEQVYYIPFIFVDIFKWKIHFMFKVVNILLNGLYVVFKIISIVKVADQGLTKVTKNYNIKSLIFIFYLLF